MTTPLTLALLSVTGLAAHAQTYTIDWFKIAGGGGTSTGGVYALSGTIGQHDPGGPLTNGTYVLTGGFWALPIVVQTAGAPTLVVERLSAGQARISWAPNTPGFVLQETANLPTTNWVNSPSGASHPVTVPATLLIKAYRLFRP